MTIGRVEHGPNWTFTKANPGKHFTALKKFVPITIGQLTTADANKDGHLGETHTYSQVSGSGDTDNSQFLVESFTNYGSLVLALKDASSMECAGQMDFSVRIRVTDSLGLTDERPLVISYHGPTSLEQVRIQNIEDCCSNKVVMGFAQLSAPNSDSGVDTNKNVFSVNNSSTSYTVSPSGLIDWNASKTINPLSLELKVIDENEGCFSQTKTYSLTRVEYPPDGFVWTWENHPDVMNYLSTGTPIKVGIIVHDQNNNSKVVDNHTLQLVADAGGTGKDTDNSKFNIDSGALVSPGPVLKFAQKPTHCMNTANQKVNIKVTDTIGQTMTQGVEYSYMDGFDDISFIQSSDPSARIPDTSIVTPLAEIGNFSAMHRSGKTPIPYLQWHLENTKENQIRTPQLGNSGFWLGSVPDPQVGTCTCPDGQQYPTSAIRGFHKASL